MVHVQLVIVFLIAAVVQNPIAAEQLKCWTCSSDVTPACKDALVANATTDPRIFHSCTDDGDVCKTQITKIGETMLITRGCIAKTACEGQQGFCEICSTSGCNNKGCDDTTCNKNGSSALGTSVALIIVSLGFLYYK